MFIRQPQYSWITRTLFFSLFLFFFSVSETLAQRAPAYPQRETDPEAVARGQELYEGYGCAFCHGGDTRGGNGGPSLLRSQLVQRDQMGELIGPVIREGVPDTEMLGFSLTDGQLADVAEFLHSFNLNSRDPSRFTPDTIVVGDAEAGHLFFNENCSQCHSVQDDLSGLAARYPDPMDLQSNWLSPRNGGPIMATVTHSNGSVSSGELGDIDEFLVVLNFADGSRSTYRRRGDVPRVEIYDPLQAHVDLLSVYSDADIHNVTAYLVTLAE